MSTSTERLLIVDDDPEIRELLERYLRNYEFEVVAVPDGSGMEQYLRAHSADLVILDLMLPNEDGFALARKLRSSSDLPILILSARSEEIDRIVGLEIGADDYLPKPFNPRELLARVRAVLRRNQSSTPPAPVAQEIYQFGPFVLEAAARRLLKGEKEIFITNADFKLLYVFATHPNQVITRDTLMEFIKGYERSPLDRSIDVRVKRLRQKIEPDPSAPVFIRTIRGEGYLFRPDGGGDNYS